MLSALLIVGACLCCLRYGAAGEARWLVLAGVLLGLIGMTRYFSLILMVPALA
jgi:4-amino-4-deoxy-L-arabinose transferase-like glycosyltransferase